MALSEGKLNGCVSAVIAAAGLSSRMGAFKPLLPFGGTTVAARCIENLRAAGVDDIVVVTGYRSGELRSALADSGVRFAENPDYRTTQMFDSLRIGLAALPGDCRRVVIQPADMPAILPETITSLLSARGAAVRPICGGQAGHPLVLDAALVPQILAHDGAGGLRGAMDALGVAVNELATEDAGILLDADTKEDYVNLLGLEEERKMRTIYLFRHALPEFPGGVKCCLGLTPDLPLSAEGTAASAEWTAFLKEKDLTGIYTSPALRCRETAAVLSGEKLPVTVVDALHEINYGEWEGLTYDEIKARYADLYAQRGDNMRLMPPGGEPFEEAAERGFTVLCSLLQETQGNIALVTHGGLSQALLWHLSGRPAGNVRSYHMDYARLAVLQYDGAEFRVCALNQSANKLT